MRLRNIVHLSVADFEIEVERQRNSRLVSRPFVIAPPHSPRALIQSASVEAREEGVFSGMTVRSALKMNRSLIVLPPDPERVQKTFSEMIKISKNYTPIWEPKQMGNLFLDLTGTSRLFGAIQNCAYQIQKEIQRQVQFVSSIGIAQNKLVSQIAANEIPCGELSQIRQGDEKNYLAPLQATSLPIVKRLKGDLPQSTGLQSTGVSPGFFNRLGALKDLNLRTVREIQAIEMAHLKMIFRRDAFHLYAQSRGIDHSPVIVPIKAPQIVESITLAQDENDDQVLLFEMKQLIYRLSAQLRKKEFATTQVSLFIRYSDLVEVQSDTKKLKQSIYWEDEIFYFAKKLFYRILKRRTRVRSIQVTLKELVPQSQQLSLFHQGKVQPKDKQLFLGLEKIRDQFGESIVRVG